MSKKPIQEGILKRVVMGMFDSIVKGKQARAKKQLANDPELKRLYGELDKTADRIQTHLKRMKKKGRTAQDAYNDVMKKYG
tara:strand:- start:1055 stop:1297 length:243 start_codon:yes stop_codon:yes gene_type:complete